MSTTSSLNPETIVLHTRVYQVAGRFYGEPEMTGIPCFPIKTNTSPIWTQLGPQTLVRFEEFDGEFYTVQPVRLDDHCESWLSKSHLAYKSHGGTALIHKSFLKYFIKPKVGR